MNYKATNLLFLTVLAFAQCLANQLEVIALDANFTEKAKSLRKMPPAGKLCTIKIGGEHALVDWKEELEFVPTKGNLQGEFEVSYDDKRLLKNFEILSPNKNPQITAALMDYCILQQPNTHGGLKSRFAYKDVAQNSESLKKIIALNPSIASEGVFLRAIPLTVIKRYPGVISEKKLRSLDNFRAISVNSANLNELSKLRSIWVEFFKTHESATEEDFAKVSKEVDSKYQSKFLPLKVI